MADSTAVLARAITRASSKQTYWVARLLVDRDLEADFFRAYAYFRWIDDIVDESSHTRSECVSFVGRQRDLIDALYRGERPDGLQQEETILADLVGHDRAADSGLQSFIRSMFAIIEFDALRRGRLITAHELTWYVSTLARSVVDGLQYFIGNGHPYPGGESRYRAATGAHIAHLLRDMVTDTVDGFVNIPREYLEAHAIRPGDVDSAPLRQWVRAWVAEARGHFGAGKRYLDGLGVLRCKIAGYWYCARFEGVLAAIERDGFRLRAAYGERRRLTTWLRIAWLAVWVTARHLLRRRRVVQAAAP